MTHELVLPRQAPELDQRQVSALLAQMLAAREHLENSDVYDTGDVYRKASLAREAIALWKQANTLGVEAARLEATALRRLGQLQAFDELPGAKERTAARGFAKMTAEAFSTFVAYIQSGALAATAEWSNHAFALKLRSQRAVDADSVLAQSAARAVVEDALRNGDPFTASTLINQLAERLAVPDDLLAEPVVRRGLRGALEQAIRQASNTPEGTPRIIFGKPVQFVTLAEADEWIAGRRKELANLRRAVEVDEAWHRALVKKANQRKSSPATTIGDLT